MPSTTDPLIEAMALALGEQLLEQNGGELDADQDQWRGYYGGNWVPFRLTTLAQSALSVVKRHLASAESLKRAVDSVRHFDLEPHLAERIILAALEGNDHE
jgi:hypothetical protein